MASLIDHEHGAVMNAFDQELETFLGSAQTLRRALVLDGFIRQLVGDLLELGRRRQRGQCRQDPHSSPAVSTEATAVNAFIKPWMP